MPLRERLTLRVEPSFWLLAAVLAWSASSGGYLASRVPTFAIWLALIFAVTLIHEAGHAGAALVFGSRAAVRLHGMGGETRHEAQPPLSFARQLVVTVSGPIVGIASGAAAWALMLSLLARGLLGWPRGPVLLYALSEFTRLSVFWNLLNLAPVPPMDGGTLLGAVLSRWFGRAGLKAAHGVGIALAGLLGVAALAAGATLSAAVFGLFALGGYQRMRELAVRTEQDDDPALQTEFYELQERVNAKDGGPAVLRRLAKLRRSAGPGVIQAAASHLLAVAFLRARRPRAAYLILRPVADRLSYQGKALLQGLACDEGDVERAIALGGVLFPEKSDPRVAYVNAAAHAKKGEDDAAIEWLKTALRLGLPDARKAVGEPEFDALRARSDYAEIAAQLDRAPRA